MSNTIRWFVKSSFDAPSLRSPQPCARGVHCDFRRWNSETQQMEPAVCHFVHPGEEGTGRRFFPARQIKETGPEASIHQQPACVRLTGARNGFYERCGRKIPWSTWCAQKGIPYTPVVAGAPFEPVMIQRINGPRTPDHPTRPALPLAPRRHNIAGRTELRIEEWGPSGQLNFCEHCDPQSDCDGDHSADRDRPRIPKRWEPDCLACHPQSGCDGDHTEEFTNGIFIRKAGPGEPRSLLAPPRPIEEPNTNGRMWYDSPTPVGALAQALMASENVDKSWHPLLAPIVRRSTPEELSVGLGLADETNIETSPYHYAQCVFSRAQREMDAQATADKLDMLDAQLYREDN
jgi:hypothetical protein